MLWFNSCFCLLPKKKKKKQLLLFSSSRNLQFSPVMFVSVSTYQKKMFVSVSKYYYAASELLFEDSFTSYILNWKGVGKKNLFLVENKCSWWILIWKRNSIFMNQNNVMHLLDIYYTSFLTYLDKKIQVYICQEWTKLFISQDSKFISEVFNLCVYRCIYLHSQFPSNLSNTKLVLS